MCGNSCPRCTSLPTSARKPLKKLCSCLAISVLTFSYTESVSIMNAFNYGCHLLKCMCVCVELLLICYQFVFTNSNQQSVHILVKSYCSSFCICYSCQLLQIGLSLSKPGRQNLIQQNNASYIRTPTPKCISWANGWNPICSSYSHNCRVKCIC